MRDLKLAPRCLPLKPHSTSSMIDTWSSRIYLLHVLCFGYNYSVVVQSLTFSSCSPSSLFFVVFLFFFSFIFTTVRRCVLVYFFFEPFLVCFLLFLRCFPVGFVDEYYNYYRTVVVYSDSITTSELLSLSRCSLRPRNKHLSRRKYQIRTEFA